MLDNMDRTDENRAVKRSSARRRASDVKGHWRDIITEANTPSLRDANASRELRKVFASTPAAVAKAANAAIRCKR